MHLPFDNWKLKRKITIRIKFYWWYNATTTIKKFDYFSFSNKDKQPIQQLFHHRSQLLKQSLNWRGVDMKQQTGNKEQAGQRRNRAETKTEVQSQCCQFVSNRYLFERCIWIALRIAKLSLPSIIFVLLVMLLLLCLYWSRNCFSGSTDNIMVNSISCLESLYFPLIALKLHSEIKSY